jgi:hypothetical protein
MSIWTELLFLHGHIATPMALALVAPAATCVAAPAAAGTPHTAAPAAAPPLAAAGGALCDHPLRAVGQLP